MYCRQVALPAQTSTAVRCAFTFLMSTSTLKKSKAVQYRCHRSALPVARLRLLSLLARSTKHWLSEKITTAPGPATPYRFKISKAMMPAKSSALGTVCR